MDSIPLSSRRVCPKDEAANPVLYPAMHCVSAGHFMNRKAISAVSQKPIKHWLPTEALELLAESSVQGCRQRRLQQQQQRAVTVMFVILKGKVKDLCQDLSLACFQAVLAPCKAIFMLMQMFQSLVPPVSKQH